MLGHPVERARAASCVVLLGLSRPVPTAYTPTASTQPLWLLVLLLQLAQLLAFISQTCCTFAHTFTVSFIRSLPPLALYTRIPFLLHLLILLILKSVLFLPRVNLSRPHHFSFKILAIEIGLISIKEFT